MRIAYVCADSGVPVFGTKGCSIHAREIIRALTKQGNQVTLYATNIEGKPPSEIENIPVNKLPAFSDGDLPTREMAALNANYDLRTALEKGGCFDLVYERYSIWSFAGMEYAHTNAIPGVLEVNSPLIGEQAQYRGLINRTGAEQIAERVFGAASALIAVSEEVAAYLKQYHAAHGRVHVVPNGVDPERFTPNVAPLFPASQGTFTIGFVGTLKPWHGLSTLIDAFALHHKEYPNTRLLIVGDGPERKNLMEKIAMLHLYNNVHLTGSVAPDKVPGLLASVDVAVAPYPVLPGFYFSPMKVYEYMAVGLPVVASNIGQLKQLIRHGVNGMLCAPGDPSDLASVLGSLQCNQGLRSRLGEAARDTVMRKYTWDGVVQSILRITSCISGAESQCLEPF